ncbi:MAG TPA: hypothetical protein VFY34_13980 [Pyrinomonadaceae bacterium]|nr:hypothetical protein [Pyrinomonadaceae bacterium]
MELRLADVQPIRRRSLATDWNAQSSGVRERPIKSCPTQGGKLFGDCLLEAYKSWRGAYHLLELHLG